MGNIVSSPIHKGSHHIDNDGGPPLKRRRISSPDSLDVDHLIASPHASDSRSALRVEVLKIAHKDSKKVIPTKASCRITISELSAGRARVVHCQSQVCDLTTFKNPVGPHRIARVALPKPFYIPQESILINRADDDTFDLADSYEIVVELEAAHDGHWPPLDSSDFGILPTSSNLSSAPGKAWVLSSRFDQIFGRLKSSLFLSARYSADEPPVHTDYAMDIDLRWSAGFKALKRLEKGSMPCINAVDPDADPSAEDFFAPSVNGGFHGINGHHVDESSIEMDDDGLDGPDGAQTPSRSLRTREKNKVYNLKVLSDQAQGREKSVVHGLITLRQMKAVLAIFYLLINRYVLETTSQGPQFRVTSRCEPMLSPSKQYQIKPPVKPFILETYLDGDHSWISSRLGPDTVDDVFTFSRDKNPYDRLPSQSPVVTQPRPVQRRPGTLRSDKILVPNIKQPLFDPISRARLIPGQEVPKRPLDNTWLIQKHRESTSDFSDVTPAEKEYIWEWDGYILRQSLTSVAYFPRAWLGFVREKASWLAAADQRVLEFGKHASLLRVRDMLDDGIIQEALTYINNAREGLQPDAGGESGNAQTEEPDPKQSPKATQIRKGANGCTYHFLNIY
ncbi:hypothetical protein TrVFT333_009972 [Trichoderma virens FT-333]|nr:hypothetical protein TrVFT333_009972 [Trichoderma virens FT-333]